MAFKLTSIVVLACLACVTAQTDPDNKDGGLLGNALSPLLKGLPGTVNGVVDLLLALLGGNRNMLPALHQNPALIALVLSNPVLLNVILANPNLLPALIANPCLLPTILAGIGIIPPSPAIGKPPLCGAFPPVPPCAAPSLAFPPAHLGLPLGALPPCACAFQ